MTPPPACPAAGAAVPANNAIVKGPRLWYEGAAMMKRSLFVRASWLLAASALLAAPLTLPGCRQSEGDRCQITSDCQDPLYCELNGKDPSLGGVCKSRTTTDAAVSAVQDLSGTTDLTSVSDAGDGGAVDGGG